MLSTLASICAIVSAGAAVLLPSQDPFYTQPANISAYAPGDIINSRNVPPHLHGFLPGLGNANVKAVYQYLYRTTDSLGHPIAAVNSLLVPFNADPSKLVVYQTAYDSASNDCSPSYAYQSGANTTALADIAFIYAALDLGWYVSSADYEGLNAHYVAGLISGYATLDSVRSVFKDTARTGLSPSARYVMWGYSGGSLACEWAAELQPSYAPELKFEGAALGGLIPNIQSVLQTINGGPFAGLAFAGIFGLSKAYPDLGSWLDVNLVPSKKAQFFSIANECITELTTDGAFKNVFTYFVNGSRSLSDPVPASVLQNAGLMGTHGTPKIPLFIYKANGDEVSPAADTDKLVTKYCGQGATIEYHKDVIGEHITEAITGSFSGLEWVAQRLNGVPVSTGCKTEIVALTSVDVGTFGAVIANVIGALQALLGGFLGPVISG